MKKAARNILILILTITIPACFSQNFISSPGQMKDLEDMHIISIQTNDGRVIESSSHVKLFNSQKGIYIADTSGTKLISHKDLKSIQVKQLDTTNTIILAACVGAAAFLGYLYYSLMHFRIS